MPKPDKDIVESMKSKLGEKEKKTGTNKEHNEYVTAVKKHALVLNHAKGTDVYEAFKFFVQDYARRVKIYDSVDIEENPDLEYRRLVKRQGVKDGLEFLMGCFTIKDTYCNISLKSKVVKEEVLSGV